MAGAHGTAKTLAGEWATFNRDVLPKTAPPIQRTECRNAFYAGAQSLFGLLMTVLEPGDTEPTEADLKAVDALNDELQAFAAELVERAAAAKRARH